METRLLPGCEIRTADEGTEKGFQGRVVPYNVLAPIGHRLLEAIAPGCFTKSIKEAARQLPLMLNHKHDDLPIGKMVEWADAEDGLYARWVMADTEQAATAHRLIQDGILSGLSVGFIPQRAGDKWDHRKPPEVDTVVRTQARLAEVSVVSVPTWAEAVVTHTRTSMATELSLTPHLDAWKDWRASV